MNQIDSLLQDLEVAHSKSDSYREYDLLRKLGDGYFFEGQLDLAIKFYNQALNLARQKGDLEEVSSLLSKIASCFASLGQSEQAIEYYSEARDLVANKLSEESMITSGGTVELWERSPVTPQEERMRWHRRWFLIITITIIVAFSFIAALIIYVITGNPALFTLSVIPAALFYPLLKYYFEKPSRRE